MVQLMHPTCKLNLNHFKEVEAMGLELSHQSPLEWHHLLTKFHETLTISSKVIREDTETDGLVI
jgi:hypothetical protein